MKNKCLLSNQISANIFYDIPTEKQGFLIKPQLKPRISYLYVLDILISRLQKCIIIEKWASLK